VEVKIGRIRTCRFEIEKTTPGMFWNVEVVKASR